MKITPLEIRQKSFEKNLRGYDKDEVTAFLVSLSQEWEKLLDELKDSKMRLESSEREVSKLREVEGTLFKTLKTAEDTGNHLIEQANKAAELQLRESQLQAEGLLYEARTKAKSIVEEAEVRSQQILDEIESQLKTLVQEYRGMVAQKENFSSDLLRLSAELNDRAERLKKIGENFNPDQYLSRARQEIHPNEVVIKKPTVIESSEQAPTAQHTTKKPSSSGSFFDEIG